MSTKHEVAVELAGGKRLVFETGRMAKQASGAALVSTGETVVLATAVASAEPREGIDFFPLTVDYREYTYAGGRIPGGVCVLAVIHGKGEKVDAFPGFGRGHSSGQNDGFARAHQCGARGLLGHAPRLKNQPLATG